MCNTIIQGVCIAFTIRNCFFNIASCNISSMSVEHSEMGVYVIMGSEITFHNVNVSHCDSFLFLIRQSQ